MAEEEVNVSFGANIEALSEKMNQVRELLLGLTNPIRAVHNNLGELAEAFAAAFAVERISEWVEHFSELGAEVEHATHELGMSAESISTLNVAFDAMGLHGESASMALMRLERNMITAQSNAQGPAAAAFRAVGIPLEQLKDMKADEVLNRLADAFEKTADGPNKTAIAMSLLGRAGAQMIPFLDRGRAGLEEFKQMAEETGTVITTSMADGMEETAISSTRLGKSFEGVGITLYEAFKPAIDTIIAAVADLVIAFNNSIRTGGTFNQLLAVLVDAVDTVIAAFLVLGATIRSVWDMALVAARDVATVWSGVGTAMYDALHGNFSKMGEDFANVWKKGMEENKKDMEDVVTTVTNTMNRLHDLYKNVSQNGLFSAQTVDTTGGPNKKPEEEKPQLPTMQTGGAVDVTKQYEEDLKKQMAFYQITLDKQKEFEIAYWQGVLDVVKKGSDEYIAAYEKLYTLTQEQAKKNQDEQKRIEQEDAAARKELAALKLQEQKDTLDEEVAQHKITVQQKIAALKELTTAEYDEQIKALQDQIAVGNLKVAEAQKINDQITVLEEKKNIAIENLTKQAMAAQEKSWDGFKNTVDNTMDQMLAGILRGTQTWQQAMQRVGQNLVIAFAEAGAKMVANAALDEGRRLLQHTITNTHIIASDNAMEVSFLGRLGQMLARWTGLEVTKTAVTNQQNAVRAASDTTANTNFISKLGDLLAQWIGLETAKTGATVVGNTDRTTSDASAALAGLIVQKGVAAQVIALDAFMAAAGSYASVSAIPFVGWAMAPEVSAQAFEFVMALQSGLAAEQGALIPSGVNPMVQLHQEEIVLPKGLSKGLQDMVGQSTSPAQIGGTGGGGGGGNPINVNLNVQTMDAKSFQAFIAQPTILRNLGAQLNQYMNNNPSIRGGSMST